MRHYISKLAESILAELEIVPSLDNASKEIGSGGNSVDASMSDILPHNGVFDRNKPQAFSQIFAKTTTATGFKRETPPENKDLKKRRNNDAGIKKLKLVPKGGDAAAILHRDFANRRPHNKSIIPKK